MTGSPEEAVKPRHFTKRKDLAGMLHPDGRAALVRIDRNRFMPAAPLPEDETERLRALRHTGLLESGADPVLDMIVRQAAALFGAPIAVVSLLDATRQSFKASVGIGVPHTDRDVAFCGYAILQLDPLVVLDAPCDTRFADNALVVGAPGIRFYAGAPIYSVSGHRLGALCVIDIAARQAPAPALIDTLGTLAADVSTQFARCATMPGRSLRRG